VLWAMYRLAAASVENLRYLALLTQLVLPRTLTGWWDSPEESPHLDFCFGPGGVDTGNTTDPDRVVFWVRPAHQWLV
jgi:hypothetical protein